MLYVHDNRQIYRTIQQILLNIGSQIATINVDKKALIPKITDENVEMLEKSIDEMELTLPKLTVFILPGASMSDSCAHVCRAVSRRAERELWKLCDTGYSVDENIKKFMNRLSDYFFVISRDLVYKQSLAEITREKVAKPDDSDTESLN
jgi:cob(I)alamin adenosyltransferase